MRLVCLNAWGGALHEALIPWLVQADADVICLQEVIHTPDAPRDVLTYRDGDHVLPQRARLLDDLRRALPAHVGIFCPAATGVLWDGDRSVPSHWGLATFVRDRVPVIAQVQGFVHKGYTADGYGDHPRSRSAHAVRLWIDNSPLVVAQMHGLRDPEAGKRDTPERAAQADHFLALAQSVAEPGDGMILCGDFNVEPGSETLQRLKVAGLRELVTGKGHPGTRTSHYSKPGRFADYMLVNDQVPPFRFNVVRAPEVSDHCPLVIET